MAYKHQYFSVEAESRKVFDENNKELKLTGNAYRVLVFLCENKNATITKIGSHLDFAKDYDENHIRQYRYKINTIVGHNIVDYKNGVYSIIGEVKEADKLEKNLRNTDLLQHKGIELSPENTKKFMGKVNNIKFSRYPAVIAIIALLLTFFPWPYSYYNLLRILITVIAIYYAYYLYSTAKEQGFWFWTLIIIVLLFNPLFPIYLWSKELWIPIDIAVGLFFGFFTFKFNC